MKSDDIGRRIGHHSAHRGAQSDISRTELFAIYSAGARLQPQPSRALPQHSYGDPARHAKLRGEAQCDACRHSRPDAQGAFCGQGNQYGKSCIQFKEKSWR